MSWAKLFQHELHTIFTNPAVVLTVFVGIVFYSFLYPQPYAQQVPRNLALVVANLDNSQMSRELERMVEATPQIKIVKRTTSIEQAKEHYLNERLAGILVIPENFYRDIMLGKRPTLSYSGDASYFLVYGTIFEGLSKAGGTLTACVKIRKMMLAGKPKEELVSVALNVRPVFNSTGGYLSYVLPGVFVLILHHTLIIGAGLVTGVQKEQEGEGGYWQEVSAAKILLVRGVVFSLIYLLLSCYYFGFSLSCYEVPRLASIPNLFMIWLPFVAGAIFFGILLGRILPRSELVTLVVILSSLPLIFTSGFIWPIEALPVWFVAAVQWVPVSPAIHGFLLINQFGAELSDVLSVIIHQWLLALFFGLGAWVFLQRGRESRNTR